MCVCVCVCLILCDLETSKMGRSRPDVVCYTTEKKCLSRGTNHEALRYIVLSVLFLPALGTKRSLQYPVYECPLFMSCLQYTLPRNCRSCPQSSWSCNGYAVYCILYTPDWNIGCNIKYPLWGFSWFSSDLPEKISGKYFTLGPKVSFHILAITTRYSCIILTY